MGWQTLFSFGPYAIEQVRFIEKLYYVISFICVQYLDLTLFKLYSSIESFELLSRSNYVLRAIGKYSLMILGK